MTVKDVLNITEIVNDKTTVRILEDLRTVLANGKWFEDKVLKYHDSEIDYFSWETDADNPEQTILYINLK